MTPRQLNRLSTALAAATVVLAAGVVALIFRWGRDEISDAESFQLCGLVLIPLATIIAALVAQDRAMRTR